MYECNQRVLVYAACVSEDACADPEPLCVLVQNGYNPCVQLV